LECRNYTEPFIFRVIFTESTTREKEKTEEEREEGTKKVIKKKIQTRKIKNVREEGNNKRRDKETE
jgi:hypothetical protein